MITFWKMMFYGTDWMHRFHLWCGHNVVAAQNRRLAQLNKQIEELRNA